MGETTETLSRFDGGDTSTNVLPPNDVPLTTVTSTWTRNPNAYVTGNDEVVCRWNLDDIATATWAAPR